MSPRTIGLAYVAVEGLAAYAVAGLLGWGTTLLLLLAGIPVGFAVMGSAGRGALGELQAAGSTGLPPGRGSRHAMRFAAGVLIAVPGFVTDVLGLALLLPPVQAVARRWIARRMPGGPSGEVIASTVVRERQEPSSPGELGS